MGAWGPAIFSDDTACDIRGDYRELLEDDVPDEDATRRVIESYSHLDDDEEHILWLALAASQSGLGRLDRDVQRRALDVIDSGRGLELWEEAGPRELAKRQAALAKLREQLTGPQPARKPVRRPWRHVTDLEPGDVLSFTASNGLIALLRVARIDDHRVGAAPMLERLDWHGRTLPPESRLRRLDGRADQRPEAPGANGTFRSAKHRKRDPDWRDSGFELVAKRVGRSGDDALTARVHVTWPSLRAILERELERQS